MWSRRAIADSSHTRRGRQEFEEPVNNWKSGTYIDYNCNPPCSFVKVTPTSHCFVFHWLLFTFMCYLFHIGYLPKPTSTGRRICHHLPSSTTSIGQGDIPIITLLILSLAGWNCQLHPLCSTPSGYGDISVITLLILCSAEWSCQQHMRIREHLQDIVTYQ